MLVCDCFLLFLHVKMRKRLGFYLSSTHFRNQSCLGSISILTGVVPPRARRPLPPLIEGGRGRKGGRERGQKFPTPTPKNLVLYRKKPTPLPSKNSDKIALPPIPQYRYGTLPVISYSLPDDAQQKLTKSLRFLVFLYNYSTS